MTERVAGAQQKMAGHFLVALLFTRSSGNCSKARNKSNTREKEKKLIRGLTQDVKSIIFAVAKRHLEMVLKKRDAAGIYQCKIKSHWHLLHKCCFGKIIYTSVRISNGIVFTQSIKFLTPKLYLGY